jgi:hypothetical protein
MGALKFLENGVRQTPATGKSITACGGALATQRLSTDSLFSANIDLQGIVTGSRYWVARVVGGVTQSTPLTSGVAGSTTVTLSNIPAYENPMLVEIRVRKASSADNPKYAPFTTYGYLVKAGLTAFIAQVEDPIA